MHGPNGADYQNRRIFVEVVTPERIVFDHVSGAWFWVTATFEGLGGKTKVTYRMLFDSVAECDKVKAFAVEANEQYYARLEGQLAEIV